MRDAEEVNRAIDKYADTVRRVCFLYLKDRSDTEDVFQTVFLKYLTHPIRFESDTHEKAWILRVTINACKDLSKSFFRSRSVSLDETAEPAAAVRPDLSATADAVLSLPSQYKEVILLHYYEGYTAADIGKILHKKTNTVYTLLSRAKAALKEKLGDINE